jgi:hypothetical protein
LHTTSTHSHALFPSTSPITTAPIMAGQHDSRAQVRHGQHVTEHLLIYLSLFWTPHLTLMLIGSSFLSLSHRTRGDASWSLERATAFSSDAGRLALLHLRLF